VLAEKFIIVGTQRTGSSALAEVISLSPRVACGWEWTRTVSWWKRIKTAQRALAGDFSCLSQRYRNHMAQILTPECSWLGFRRLFSSSPKWLIHPRFSPALWIDRLEAHIHWLARTTNIHIIHIVRRDSLEWLKSVYLSKQSGLYVGKAYPEDINVTIRISEAVARLRSKDWVDSRLATLRNSSPYLQVSYEDFLANPDRVTGTALRFLGCGPIVSNTKGRHIYKQSRRQAADYISNYNELYEKLERLDLLTSRLVLHLNELKSKY